MESLTDQYFRQYIGSDNLGFQEQRAQNQSSIAKLGAGLGNAVTQGSLDILAWCFLFIRFLKTILISKFSTKKGFHNWLGDMEKAEDKLKLPVYRTEDSKGFSPLSAGFLGWEYAIYSLWHIYALWS